jgi:hypothetical protein
MRFSIPRSPLAGKAACQPHDGLADSLL